MELAMVHDPWRRGGYNADSDYSAPWPGSETQDKRCVTTTADTSSPDCDHLKEAAYAKRRQETSHVTRQ
jgi:hypothetical protein